MDISFVLRAAQPPLDDGGQRLLEDGQTAGIKAGQLGEHQQGMAYCAQVRGQVHSRSMAGLPEVDACPPEGTCSRADRDLTRRVSPFCVSVPSANSDP